jgi:ABC-type uncharacterized transport system permease subunit
MKKLFYLSFGFPSVIIGFGIGLWLMYNLFIERQEEFTGIANVRQLLIPVVFIGCGIYWIRKGFNLSNKN